MNEVDPYSDVPVYVQIMEQIRESVASGRLRPGDRLEPVRSLAGRLGVNPSTVARAYQMLEHDGVIETNRRRGSVIARRSDPGQLASVRRQRLNDIVERAVVQALAHGFSPGEVEASCELQLAAWRERRRPAPAGGPAPAAGDVLRFAGSHDLALEALWVQARAAQPPISVAAAYVGSLDGLLALLHGDADLSGSHILDEESGEYNLPILRRLFVGHRLIVVTLAEREQGLIVRRGNPLALAGWEDLARPGLRLVNRQAGSGTRTLLDYHLACAGIPAAQLSGYRFIAPTHLAVAAAVSQDQADVGLGVAAAARAYDLDFVLLARERYDLVLPAELHDLPAIAGLLAILRTPAYRELVADMGGYDVTAMGREQEL